MTQENKQVLSDDIRELRKWLNEELGRPIDRVALARVLAALQSAGAGEPVAPAVRPACPQAVVDAITAYGDARADQEANGALTTSHLRLNECIHAIRDALQDVAHPAPAGDELTVAGIAMAAGCKAGPLMRAIRDAGEGNVTMNQRLSKDQALQAIAAITKPAGDATQGDAVSGEAFDAGALMDALRHLIEVYDAMGAPRGPARIMAEAALASRAGQEDKGGVE